MTRRAHSTHHREWAGYEEVSEALTTEILMKALGGQAALDWQHMGSAKEKEKELVAA